MDALIATFIEELKHRVAMYNEDPDGNLFNDASSTDADGKIIKIFIEHVKTQNFEVFFLFFRLFGPFNNSFSAWNSRILS